MAALAETSIAQEPDSSESVSITESASSETSSSLPASSEPDVSTSEIDSSVSLPEEDSSVAEPGSSSEESIMAAQAFASTAIPATTFSELSSAVQSIVSSGQPGVIDVQNDITFTSTISISDTADITFTSSSAVSLYAAANVRFFNFTGSSTQVALRFENVTLDGNSVGGGFNVNIPKLSLYGAVIQNIKTTSSALNLVLLNSELLLDNCVLDKSTTGKAAISMQYGKLTLNQSKITNTVGMAITADASAGPLVLNMTNSAIEDNRNTGYYAAGINMLGPNLTVQIDSSSISRNITTSSSPSNDYLLQGGGIRVVAPVSATSGNIQVDITNSTFASNGVDGGSGGHAQFAWGGSGAFIASRETSIDGHVTEVSKVSVTTNITSSTFSDNWLQQGTGYYASGGQGDALYTDGRLNIYGSTFSGNGRGTADSVGTVVVEAGAANGSGITLQDDAAGRRTVFEDNVAYISGVYTLSHPATITGSKAVDVMMDHALFQNNTGVMATAAYFSEGNMPLASTKVIKNSSFFGNKSISNIDGLSSSAVVESIYNNSPTEKHELRIENCLFDQNEGYSQGASVHFKGSGGGYSKLFVTDSRFTNNKITGTGSLADFGGAAIYMPNASNDLGQITNTAFSGNSAPQGRYTQVNPFASRCVNILSSTLPFAHPFNNFDINYTGGNIAQIYDVTFDSQGGSAVDAIQAIRDTTITAPPAPTKPGFVLGGWYRDTSFSTPWVFDTDTVEGNTTLYAKWDVQTFTVHFDSQGGTPVPSITQVPQNTVIAEPNTPTRSGFSFAGWYTDTSFGTKWNFATQTVQKETTLYAKWTANQYTVTFDSQGGSPVSPATVLYGSLVTAPANPTRTGYEFGGWYQDAKATNAWNFATDKVNGSLTLYAKWTLIPPVSSSSAPVSSSAPPVSSSTAPVSSSTAPVSSSSSSSTISSSSSASSSSSSSSSSRSASSSAATISSSSAASSSSASASSSQVAPASSGSQSGGTLAPAETVSQQQREETRERLIDAGVPSVQIGETRVPLFGGQERFVWSLLSLILAIAGAVLSLILGIRLVIRREENQGTRKLLQILSMVLGVVSLLLFLVLYNLSGVMVFIDVKTILFAVLLAGEVVTLIFSKKWAQENA